MSLGLHNLGRNKKAVHNRKRVGRGPGSGHGKTATRGHKGQKSRSGYSRKIGFEGGQMPLYRRLPKRGFHNKFRKIYAIVNISDLEKKFEDGAVITPEEMIKAGLVKKVYDGIKVLGDGEISKNFKVTAHRFSKSAKEKIINAGGNVEVINE